MSKIAKKVTSVFKKIDPFTSKVIDPLLGSMGLPNVSGRNAAQEAAAEQAKETARREEAALKQQRDIAAQQSQMQAVLAANQSRDLSSENIANIIPGGTAETVVASDSKKRKQASGGLASTLGLS
jgi:PPE-repeat protein